MSIRCSSFLPTRLPPAGAADRTISATLSGEMRTFVTAPTAGTSRSIIHRTTQTPMYKQQPTGRTTVTTDNNRVMPDSVDSMIHINNGHAYYVAVDPEEACVEACPTTEYTDDAQEEGNAPGTSDPTAPRQAHREAHTPSIAFQHLPPNSAGFGYATEGALFISAQLSSDAVSALRKVWVLI